MSTYSRTIGDSVSDVVKALGPLDLKQVGKLVYKELRGRGYTLTKEADLRRLADLLESLKPGSRSQAQVDALEEAKALADSFLG